MLTSYTSCSLLASEAAQQALDRVEDEANALAECRREHMSAYANGFRQNAEGWEIPITLKLVSYQKIAIRCLQERPVLFKYCAEEVANMRHNASFKRFISSLTRGGPGGLPRPIEVHTHDPLRYVGDMLEWLHQALASEIELVLALLDPDAVFDLD